MIFETMQSELRELVDLVRRTTEWNTTIACGKVRLEEVPADALEMHRARSTRAAELQSKYGL
jgi:hypothetical protein